MTSSIDWNDEPNTAGQLVKDEDKYEPEVLNEDLDDSQGGYLSPSAANNLYLNDQNRDDQDAALAGETQSCTWRVDPNFGQYYFNGKLKQKLYIEPARSRRVYR